MRVRTNSFWLVAHQVVRMGVAFFVVLKLAKFLGPEQFGAYSYVLAYVSLFAAVSTLGLQSVVIDRFVKEIC